jgi:hypothetical protein
MESAYNPYGCRARAILGIKTGDVRESEVKREIYINKKRYIYIYT